MYQKWLCFLCLISFDLFAAEANIYDLQYLPDAGMLYGHTDATYTSGEAKNTNTVAIYGWTYAQTIGWAPTDKFLLSARIRNTALTYEYFTGSKAQFTGWSDPSLEGRYRILNENFILDFIGGGILSTDSSYINFGGTANAHGSNDADFLGGPQVFMGLEIGQKREYWQYAFQAFGYRVMNSTSRFKGEPTQSNDPYNIWTLQGSLLNNLNSQKLFLHSFIGTRLVDGYLAKASESNEKFAIAPIIEYRMGTGLDYALSPSFLWNTGVTYREFKFDSGSIKYYYMLVWDVGLKYQFQ